MPAGQHCVKFFRKHAEAKSKNCQSSIQILSNKAERIAVTVIRMIRSMVTYVISLGTRIQSWCCVRQKHKAPTTEIEPFRILYDTHTHLNKSNYHVHNLPSRKIWMDLAWRCFGASKSMNTIFELQLLFCSSRFVMIGRNLQKHPTPHF